MARNVAVRSVGMCLKRYCGQERYGQERGEGFKMEIVVRDVVVRRVGKFLKRKLCLGALRLLAWKSG